MRVVRMGNMAAIYTTIKKSVFDKAGKYNIEKGYAIREGEEKHIKGIIFFDPDMNLPFAISNIYFNAVNESDGTLKAEFQATEDMTEEEFIVYLRKYLIRYKDIIEEFERRYETLEREIDEKERSIDALITTL